MMEPPPPERQFTESELLSVREVHFLVISATAQFESRYLHLYWRLVLTLINSPCPLVLLDKGVFTFFLLPLDKLVWIIFQYINVAYTSVSGMFTNNSLFCFSSWKLKLSSLLSRVLKSQIGTGHSVGYSLM